MEQQHVFHGYQYGEKDQWSLLSDQVVGINSKLLQEAFQSLERPAKRQVNTTTTTMKACSHYVAQLHKLNNGLVYYPKTILISSAKPFNFRSFLMVLHRAFLGLPLLLMIWLSSIWYWRICWSSSHLPNHPRHDPTNFSLIDITLTHHPQKKKKKRNYFCI